MNNTITKLHIETTDGSYIVDEGKITCHGLTSDSRIHIGVSQKNDNFEVDNDVYFNREKVKFVYLGFENADNSSWDAIQNCVKSATKTVNELNTLGIKTFATTAGMFDLND